MASALPAVQDVVASGPESFARVVTRGAGLVASIAGLILEARLTPGSTTAFADRANRTARRILEGHGVTVRVAGTLPVGRAIVVTNHVSYLDPLVVSSVVPCRSIAKGETRAWPLVGAGMADLGVLFVRRGDAHSGAVTLRRAMRALADGAAVLNFPEGTTTDGRSIGPFRRGIFGLARLAGVPVVPARLTYDEPAVAWYGGAAFAPHYARLCRVARVTATVRFARPMVVAESDDPTDAAHRARAVIAALPAA
jgi:lyso-ornithine lipid O-acyltransferase